MHLSLSLSTNPEKLALFSLHTDEKWKLKEQCVTQGQSTKMMELGFTPTWACGIPDYPLPSTLAARALTTAWLCFRVRYRQILVAGISEELLPPSGEGHQSHSAGSVLFFSGGSSRKDFSLKTPLDLCPLSMPPDLFNFWHIICLSTGWRRQR